jgi:transposase
MHQYPSDISRAEYNLIREDLEGARKKTRPRTYDLYDVFCAVLYVVQGGIQWRMLPSDYPKWQSVYYYFRVWSEKDETGVSILDKVLQKLVKQIRNEDLRRDKTSFGIVDAQSV